MWRSTSTTEFHWIRMRAVGWVCVNVRSRFPASVVSRTMPCRFVVLFLLCWTLNVMVPAPLPEVGDPVAALMNDGEDWNDQVHPEAVFTLIVVDWSSDDIFGDGEEVST